MFWTRRYIVLELFKKSEAVFFPKMEVAVVVVHVEVAEVEIQLLMDAEPDDCRGRDHGPNPANASQGFAFYWGNSYTYDQTFYAWN